MYNEKIEALIKAALADGVLTEKEKQVLFKNAQAQGIDLDEFEMVLDARLVELQKAEKEKAAKSAPKSDKYGSVRKCPACGAIVGAFKGVCPECGFEFTEVDANLSSKKLAELLLKESYAKKKQEIIETFPLPNTKADLLEFLTALKPRILDTTNELAGAYYKKYSECIEKSKVTFSGDKQLQPFIDDFSKLQKELQKKRITTLFIKYWKFIVPAVVILIMIIIPTISAISSNIKQNKLVALVEEQCEQFEEYVKTKDVENAIKVHREIKRNRETLYDVYDYLGWEELVPSSYAINELIRICLDEDVNIAIEIYRNLVHTGIIDDNIEELLKQTLLERGLFRELKTTFYYPDSESVGGADDHYNYMADVVSYLCQNKRKTEARQFIQNNISWFVKYVDPEKNDSFNEWVQDYYKSYNSQTAKAKLLQLVNSY